MNSSATATWTIRQLIPAQAGWRAMYASNLEPDEEEGGVFGELIVAWALVEFGGETLVAALSIAEPAETAVPEATARIVMDTKSGFLGFDYPDCQTNWERLAQLHREHYWDEAAHDWIE